MTDVYIIVIQTRQMDTRVGAVYRTQEEADAECRRLAKAQSGLEVNEAYWVVRQLER
jgi:hypothetical protein